MTVALTKPKSETTIQRVTVWDSPWLNLKFLLGSGIILLVILFGLLGPLFWDL